MAARLSAISALLGGGSWGRKLGIAGGTMLAGMGASAYIGHESDRLRNYMGQARYDSYYGSGAETLQGTTMAAAAFFGLPALIGRDLYSRSAQSIKYYRMKHLLPTLGPEAANKLLLTPRLGLTQLGMIGSFIGGSALVSNPGLALTAVGGAVTLAAGAGITKAYRSLDGVVKNRFGRALSSYLGGYSNFAIGTGLTAAGTALGYKAVNSSNRAAGEGNITAMDSGSAVSRMNWSTAGIGLAIHNKTRKVTW